MKNKQRLKLVDYQKSFSEWQQATSQPRHPFPSNIRKNSFNGLPARLVRYHAGFTLLEILIALFVFSIVSVMLSGALRSVINAQASTEQAARRLHAMQMTLLLISRDIEKTVNRPVLNTEGKQEPAFIGTAHAFAMTRLNPAYATGLVMRSDLQRVGYYWSKQALLRISWRALDRAPQSKSSTRKLLTGVTAATFKYLDQDGQLQDHWPVAENTKQPLPSAVQINLTMSQWGEISQLYVISTQSSKLLQAQPKH